MKKSIVTGIAALVVFGLGASVSAVAATQRQLDDGNIAVSFADLNIQNAAGAKVLYSRLQRAAESACNLASYYELGSLTLYAKAKRCYAEKLDGLVARIESEALQEIHKS